MKKAVLLSFGMLGWLVQSASAQVSLFTTANDFAQFNGGAGNVSSLYYSDSSIVNGLGNTTSPGGESAVGSLQLTVPGGWGGISDAPGQAGDQGFLSALDPGASAGALVAYSGSLSYDVYRGNLTDWNQFGVIFNYNGNWNSFFSSTTTDFTGADGNTWTHVVIPYTINAVSGLTYFQLSVAENAGGNVAGETIYVDNFQVPQVVPEPGTVALLGLSGMGALVLRRRAAR